MNYKHILSLSLFMGWANSAFSVDLQKEPSISQNSNVYFSLLYLKPSSDNLDYAYFVSGTQPYFQNWHEQAVKPGHSPGYELGFNYSMPDSRYTLSSDWTHLHTRDAAFKQANQNVDLATLEFVAPPFEMSPPMFGVKRAQSTVKFNFDSIDLNFGRRFDFGSLIRARVFGGLDVLRVNQTVSTVFSDFPGAVPTFYSYALPPDPSYSFQLASESNFIGVGPDLGLNLECNLLYGIGLIGQASGTIAAGTTTVREHFTSTSARLTSAGIGTSHQAITVPSKTQVVPGVDAKLGVLYRYTGKYVSGLTIEGGYRIASYLNAITTVRPATLVQAGTKTVTPNFATGTMAIVSVDNKDRPFNFNGPYVNLKLAFG